MITVAVSGGFDPVHRGHIKLFKEARQLGDRLIVILNRDDFILRKKGYVFMSQEERKEIIESIRWVDEVVLSVDKDQTIAESIRHYCPDIFANGGDRVEPVPEEDLACWQIGCNQVFGVGGGKVQSSSQLVAHMTEIG